MRDKLMILNGLLLIVLIAAVYLAIDSSNGEATLEQVNVFTAELDTKTITNKSGLVKVTASEVRNYLQSQNNNNDYYTGNGAVFRTFGVVEESVAAMDSSESASVKVGSDSASGFEGTSSTNVQYEDVDEADIFKNDVTHVYFIQNNKLLIYRIDKPEKVSEIQIEALDNYAYPSDLMIKNNKLILFVRSSEKSYYFQKYDIQPRETYKSMTVAQVYDIEDKSNPELIDEYIMSGNYHSSRLIGDHVYVLSQESSGDGGIIYQPFLLKENERIAPDIWIAPNQNNYWYNNILSFNLETNEMNTQSYLLSYTNTLMMSENAIYISQNDYRYNYGYQKERYEEVIYPNLPEELKSQIDDVEVDESLSEIEQEDQRWEKISSILATFFEERTTDEDTFDSKYKELFENIIIELEKYDYNQRLEQQKTKIHKITIDDLEIEYIGFVEVLGNMINQFSMDEYDGDLRVATTVNIWTNQITRFNNVYKFNEDLDLVGELNNIAPDESIFSARFVGDRLYLVTFEQIDPFFVIDLSDKPKILGELKITGFSQYLHPLDENRILGFGKEATKDGRTEGLKLAIFDVSNVASPKEIAKEVIGIRGSHSPLLSDHKALTILNNKMILPLTIVESSEAISPYRYSNEMWYGAYVYDVETGLNKVAEIEHAKSKTDYFNWYDRANVKRSAIMSDMIVTLSDKYLKINDASNKFNDIETFKISEEVDKRIEPYPLKEPIAVDSVEVAAVAEIEG